MKRSAAISTLGILVALLLGAVAYLVADPWPMQGSGNRGVFTNNSYINGLYTNLNLVNSRDVFQHIFRDLPDEVIVYPSENYYYFKTTIRGIVVSGAFALTLNRIDSGRIGFGYAQTFPYRGHKENPRLKPLARDFGDSDGVAVHRIDDLKYAVSFQGKTVMFNFYDVGVQPPKKSRLTADEVYVGPSFDESGLRFHLIFNNTARRLYWILNEDGYVPEKFIELTPNISLGTRTEFAFYNDSTNKRKILVGVQGDNSRQNNWFDGPFDQLPDNYVRSGKVELKKYIDIHHNYPPDRIDKYGNFTINKFARTAVAPYCVYQTKEDLQFIDSLKEAGLPPSEFYAKITTESCVDPEDGRRLQLDPSKEGPQQRAENAK